MSGNGTLDNVTKPSPSHTTEISESNTDADYTQSIDSTMPPESATTNDVTQADGATTTPGIYFLNLLMPRVMQKLVGLQH